MQKPGLFGMNGFMGLLLTFFSFGVRAQQPGYLILVDAENRQSFAVRIGDQSYFSSVHGHLVLSQLKDSTYKLGFRFPKKNIAEQVFTVAIHRKDLGFQLKGSDTSMVLFNWQTKETIRPAYEKDSSRLLDQGVKRDDAFSRLMAAVVNDTAVMYNTYNGNGFGNDSNSLIAKNQKAADVPSPKSKAQNPHSDSLVTSSGQKMTAINQSLKTNIHHSDSLSAVKGQPAVVAVQPPLVVKRPVQVQDKDSLLAIKRQELRIQDSLNTARKTASKDSLILAKKQETYLRDSLNTARKTAVKDSISTAKKRQAFLKDSLVAVRKATRDSLLAARKNGGSAEDQMAAKRTQKTNDSLLAASKEKVYQDSLLAVYRANFVKDSLEQVATTGGSRHSSLTQVRKLREVSLKISRKMVFLDIGKDGHADTVTLFVYFESGKPEVRKPPEEAVALKKPFSPDSTEMKKLQAAKPNPGLDTVALNKTAKTKNPDSSSVSLNTTVKKSSAKSTEPPACQGATDEDTEALRSAILKANSEQEKIAVAAGAFAMKCFSVSQVRFLASLLVSDKAKYGLMDAAHWHLVDRDHFPELVDMLTDKNFQRKFLVMAEKRS